MNRTIVKKIAFALILALLCLSPVYAEEVTLDPTVETDAPESETDTDVAPESRTEPEIESETEAETAPETETEPETEIEAVEYTYTLILQLEETDWFITATSTESTCTLTWDEEPKKTGYEFLGWALQGNTNVIVPPGKMEYTVSTTEPVTLVPQWKKIDYTITFDLSAYDGKIDPIDPITYQIDSTVTFPQPTLEHYTFKGWKVAASTGAFEPDDLINDLTLSGVFGDITLTPYFEAVTYTITFVYPDDSKKEEEYTVEDLLVLPAYEQTGYTFTGWKVTAAKADALAKDTELYAAEEVAILFGDATLIAQIAPIDYTITLLPNGGTITGESSLSYNVISVPTIEDPQRFGYKFMGWEIDRCEADSAWADSEGTDAVYYGDVTLVATWEEETATIQYKVFEGKGGSVSVNWQTVTVLSGEVKDYETSFADIPANYPCATPIADPGYRFVGWYTVNEAREWAPVADELVNEYNVLYLQKSQTSGLYEDGYYFAVFEQSLGSLTVSAEGLEQEQSLIFDITGIPDDTTLNIIHLTVVIPAGETSVTIESLPVGEYTVTERSDWSWRYEDAEPVQLTVIFNEKAAQLDETENGEEETTPAEEERENTSEAIVDRPGQVTFKMAKTVDLWLDGATYCKAMPAEPAKEESDEE